MVEADEIGAVGQVLRTPDSDAQSGAQSDPEEDPYCLILQPTARPSRSAKLLATQTWNLLIVLEWRERTCAGRKTTVVYMVAPYLYAQGRTR